MTPEEFAAYVKDLAECCLSGKLTFDPHDAVEVVFRDEERGDYAEGEGVALARMKDGTFVVVEDSEDTTGHGCQCGSSYSVHATLEHAISHGLTQEWRARYEARNKKPEPVAPKEPEIVRKARRVIDALDM